MTTRLVTQEVTKSPTRLAAGLPIPLLLMPLQSDLRLLRGVGVATFTRSTIKRYLRKDTGLITVAAIDEPAFEQNGILIEGASENLLIRAEEFDNAAWIKVRNSITANAIVAPDGTTTADASIANTDNNNHRNQQAFTFVGTTTYTATAFVKAGNKTVCYLTVEFSDPNANTAYFDLSTGTVGTVQAGLDGATIKRLTNGWFRITATRTTIGGGASFVHVAWANADNDAVFAGDGSTVDGHNWGAPLEALPFASSYIKTVASTVPRTADNLSIDAANIPAPTADYTVSMEVDAIGFDSSLSQVLFNVAGETSRRIAWNTTTGAIEATHGAVTSVSTSTFSAGDRVKISFVVDATNQTLYINGIQEDQDAKGTVTGTATSINIGHQAGVNQAFSHIKPLLIDNVALTAAQVAAL